MKISFAAFLFMATGFLCGYPCHSWGRSLITQEVATLGKYTFEAGFSISQREDEFEAPRYRYKTVNFPVHAKLGLTRWLDFGFSLSHLSHSIKTQGAVLSGGQNALFSPELKLSPNDYLGLQLIWHKASTEKQGERLPVSRGNDFETVALFRLPTTWPFFVNLGYLFRESYSTKLGSDGGPSFIIRPGDIFESKASLEIPLKWHFSLLTELAYYRTASKKIGGIEIIDSEGSALDSLGGLTWAYGGWNIGAGTAFGLLDEQHSSFDLERGAGDILYQLSIAYKLTPRKPGQ